MFILCVFTEIISKVKESPPLCRPVVSVEEAPLDIIQLMKQAWSEEPDKRPTFEEIFKQVKTLKARIHGVTMDDPDFCSNHTV